MNSRLTTKPPRRRKVKFGGSTIEVADDQPTFWDRVEAGAWEAGTLRVIDELVDAGTCFFDLGAWVGPTALYAALRGADVVAVEADPAALDQLRRNLAANPRLAARIKVIARAIHAVDGEVTLGARRKPGDSMSSVLLASAPTRWTVDTITPRELNEIVDGNVPAFVKIDIEGGEYDLLPSLEPLLGRPSCAVLVSFHPRILAAARPDPGAQRAATQAALAPFARWASYAVGLEGAGPQQPDAAAIVAGAASKEWLFVKP